MWLKNSFTSSHETSVSVSDAIHTAIGGLLGAFDLTEEAVFLEKAMLLAGELVKAFEGGGKATLWISI